MNDSSDPERVITIYGYPAQIATCKQLIFEILSSSQVTAANCHRDVAHTSCR